MNEEEIGIARVNSLGKYRSRRNYIGRKNRFADGRYYTHKSRLLHDFGLNPGSDGAITELQAGNTHKGVNEYMANQPYGSLYYGGKQLRYGGVIYEDR